MTRNQAKKNGTSHIIREIITSILISMIISFILILILCTVAYQTDNPNRYIRPLSYVALGASSLICGFVSSKRIGMSSLISGLIGGLVYSVIMFLASLPLENTGNHHFGISILIYVAFIVLSCVGGIIGGARKISGKRRKYRH
ncbi:MAG: TIGR04086 family membrane protein [Eubacteriales bacterium]|nr:TIGR04086 family membrane protein [Eubacteriales bacterium]